MLPPIVAEFFQKSFWLQPDWLPFADGLERAPVSPGIYVLGVPQGILYSGGVSRIAYIGAAVNLKRRLSQHITRDHNEHICQLRGKFGQFCVGWIPLHGFDKDWVLTIEGETICRFERQFGRVPVCNLDVQFSPHAMLVRDLVNIAECQVCNPIPLDELKQMGIKAHRQFRQGLLRQKFTASECFYTNRWPSNEEMAEHTAKVEQANRLENLSTIYDETLATWPVSKFRELIRIAQSLSRDEGQSTVIRFQTNSRKVPRPYTWGEVAMVQARMIVGAWYSPNRIWVKVLCGKELLGQAIIESCIFRGEDKSDLPQRDKPRRRAIPKLETIESRFLKAVLEV